MGNAEWKLDDFEIYAEMLALEVILIEKFIDFLLMKKKLSLYLHIPFCKTICLYCNFLTFAHKNKKIPAYVDALLFEIQERSKNYKDFFIETIYFGGGTPSLIDPQYIKTLLQNLRLYFDIKPQAEISLECNPENVSAERIQAYQDMGINRLSLGVQTFNHKTLFRLARPHDENTILQALDVLQQQKFRNFGADFIIGLPHQNFKLFQEEVYKILNYQPVHLSYYFLSYDTRKIDIFLQDCPNEETQLSMYDFLTSTLQKNGYHHYEVSNYALKGYECKHNQRYWEQKDYIGLGLGAHSIFQGTIWENQSIFDDYLQDPLQIMHQMELDPELQRMEYIMLHLRTSKGIIKQEFEKKFQGFENLYQRAQTFLESGHLCFQKQCLKATEKGFLILDKITRDLLQI